MQCVKCGGTMTGPTYCKGGAFRCYHDWPMHEKRMDHLVWCCTTCGYVTATRTREAAALEPRPAYDAVEGA